MAAYEGTPFWGPVAVLASIFRGPHLTGFAARLIVGTLVHLVLGATLGVLFSAALPRRLPTSGIIGAGLLYGILLFLLVNFGVLRAFDLRLNTRDYVYWFFVQHAVFGLTLGIVVSLWRWAHRPQPSTPTAV
jgi:hypothetical protein